jgi:hypothetical protein
MSMVASHLVWLFRTRKIRARAKVSGETFDESAEGTQWQANGIDLEKMFLGLFSNSKNVTDHSDPLVSPEEVIPKTVPNAVV